LAQGGTIYLFLALQRLGHSLEGQILMSIGGQGYIPNLPYQLVKAGISGKVGPYEQSIGEVTDEILGFSSVAIFDESSYPNILLTRATIQ